MEDMDWLLKKEEYKPLNDKDFFINKTIISFTKLLKVIKKDKQEESGFLFKINPMLKLISTIVIVAFLSLSRQDIYTYIIAAIFLALLVTVDAKLLKRIVVLSLTIPIFTLIMLLPSMFFGNIHNSLMIVLKVVITLIAINLLSSTTPWHDITKSFKLLFISDLFILVFDITIRYIYLLGEFSLEMLYALRLRSVGKNESKLKAMANVMGNLFFKTKVSGEEMYSAMQCRGFTGEYISNTKFKFTFIDGMYLLVVLALIATYFVI